MTTQPLSSLDNPGTAGVTGILWQTGPRGWVAIPGQSQDCWCNSGVLGYSDRGVPGLGSHPWTAGVTPAFWDTLADRSGSHPRTILGLPVQLRCSGILCQRGPQGWVVIPGQSRDCRCNSGVRGYSDRGVPGGWVVIPGQSRDCRCNSGVRGYSDRGVPGGWVVIPGQSRDCRCNSGVLGYSDRGVPGVG